MPFPGMRSRNLLISAHWTRQWTEIDRNKETRLGFVYIPFGLAGRIYLRFGWATFRAVWPDWTIYCTLGNFSKPLIIPKSSTFLASFRKGVKISHFSSEIILGNFYRHLATFYWSHWTFESKQWQTENMFASKVKAPPGVCAVKNYRILSCKGRTIFK